MARSRSGQEKYPIFKDIADETSNTTDRNAELTPFLFNEKPITESAPADVQKKLQDIVSLPMPFLTLRLASAGRGQAFPIGHGVSTIGHNHGDKPVGRRSA